NTMDRLPIHELSEVNGPSPSPRLKYSPTPVLIHTLVRQRTFYRLLDPPSTIRTQLATLCRVKPFDGLHQTNVSFRNQIEERAPQIRVVMSDLNDKP